MKAVILAGGKGTRLAPYTTILPKPLMPVDDIPILEIVIRQLARYDIEEVILSVGYLAELLEAYFQDGSRYGVRITYARESEPLGTAGPLALIEGLDDTFLMMNGDVLTTLDYGHLIQYHHDQGGILTIAMHTRHIKIDLGVMHVNDRHELTAYIEKPEMDYKVSMGIYVFNLEAISYIEPGKHLDFNELVVRLLEQKERVISYPSADYWLDIGRHDDYQRAAELFIEHREKFLGTEG